MSAANFDVLVVGAGAAGITAAIGLARSGFSVAVVEAAAYPGAENWSGCVYFCENLSHPDILGPRGVEELAWERRLIERGFFATDGQSLLGMKYRDAEAFRNCYTVLRPIYDHHLAQVAIGLGVALLSETTAESLIRDQERVVGVCTQRGPLYANLVFLAEGDASHLVTREGYERASDQREAPKFLQGIKQVLEMPPGAIEELFGVGADEGVAYEMLVRNGTLNGKKIHLNAGGFLYTNRQSLSVGLVLPADNLHNHFGGDPNLLIEWFENLPALKPWFERGERGVFGTKIIRGGGAKDVPTLVDDGVAIGGAASAIGVDFPYPNFTGPATAMGLLITHAARRIRDEGNGFTRDALRRHYLEPLRKTHYWHDVEFLRRWPGYVKRTEVFFDRQIDMALGSAYVWTRPSRWFITKWINWLRLAWHLVPPAQWGELRRDFRHLGRALRMKEVAGRPALGRLLLDGTVNALRDIFRRPRANLPEAGTFSVHYTVAGETTAIPPGLVKRWFRRFSPVLAAAARKMYTNDDTPLRDKLPRIMQLLGRQINMVDIVMLGAFALGTAFTTLVVILLDRFAELFRGRRQAQPLRGFYRPYAHAVEKATDLTPVIPVASPNWDARLGRLAYDTVKASHIHVLWPSAIGEKDAVVEQGLWHVCPARVYEARPGAMGSLQIVVNFENCIKCETCWRTSDIVDWGRDGWHRFMYPVGSPVVPRLLAGRTRAAVAVPRAPLALDWWEPVVRQLSAGLRASGALAVNGQDNSRIGEVSRLLDKLDRKLQEFDEALAEEPRHIDPNRAEYLEILARYAQQLAERIADQVRGFAAATSSPDANASRIYQPLLALATATLVKAQERARRTWTHRYAWAASDGRQVRCHHLVGLRRLLECMTRSNARAAEAPDSVAPWLGAEQSAEAEAAETRKWRSRLDEVFPHGAWRELEHTGVPSPETDAVIRDLVAPIPRLDTADLTATLHPPERKTLLAELARRDPSIAYRVASHLWARDLAWIAGGSAAWTEAAQRAARADDWTCFAIVDAVQNVGEGWNGEAICIPAVHARSIVLLLGDQLAIVPIGTTGLHIEPLATLGLRGAGMARIRLEGLVLPETRAAVDPDRIRRVWATLSSADLVSIAYGMADQLCRRAIAHAASRVQFPGLFHDEDARDTIGKFGAIKKMIAEMGVRRYLIETLDQALSPMDFSTPSGDQAVLIKALVADLLGSAPGSLSYNAGQIFGGTGYSEDDILSKFYRDAAAWRYLGMPNTDTYRLHGHDLIRRWRPDGQRLAKVANEGELFDQVMQRKALQAELDEVRNARSRLRGLVGEWQAAIRTDTASDESVASNGQPASHRRPALDAGPVARAEIEEALARQNAHLLASKALILRTHARLENGYPSGTELALVRVWLEYAAVALEEYESVVRRRLAPGDQAGQRPIVEISAGPPVCRFADYVAADSPYDTGDFLVRPTNLLLPRFVPDMIETDRELSRRDRELKDLMSSYFTPREGGIPYERYIERQHRPDPHDLDFCRRHGFFRMPIPKDLGGEGRSKIDYYLVTTNAQRLADVAISLSIQANTSIGTTPVLLARDKDLPKAQKDLDGFIGDTALREEMLATLDEIVRLAKAGDSRRVQRSVQAIRERAETAVFSRASLKGLARHFRAAFSALASAATRDMDSFGVLPSAEAARSAWQDLCRGADELRAELVRRRQACDLFLRWVASGQISAFALTEPSAGSDTARVGTRAVLRSVPVERVSEGICRFIPASGKEPRFVLDAERLVFLDNVAHFRHSEQGKPIPIHFDEYDYETDEPARMRYIEPNGRRVHFTDIAQPRERDGRLWYDYWELTGAKMWITNGRMCGIMALYAKTTEGVTGFIVDRHAEGLVVGKDEAKMGQCGSPTNELSLQAVRVPRENVLGLEGRGQVNALETLNVGRAGLAMSAMAQMHGLVESSRTYALAVHGAIPEWAAWRIDRMEELRFTAEALANEVVGRFDHKQTKSATIDTAISKMIVSEALHAIIELAEDIHGLAGQTQRHLVEKRKRDARILNIYEGTNEIQRFSILKSLVTEVAPRWKHEAAEPTSHVSHEVVALETLKAQTRQRIESALATFGQSLWQNPNLQANCFLVAEAAAWLKAADSTLYRLAWLSRREIAASGLLAPSEKAPARSDDIPAERWTSTIAVGRRALERCFFEIRGRLRRFDEELAHLRRGFYAPEVWAARRLFQESVGHATPASVASRIQRPMNILVVVDAISAPVPKPHVEDGQLREPYLSWSAADRAALETALRLRDVASAPVTIQVVAVGPALAASKLREALSLGADRARLVVPDSDAVAVDAAATALAQVLGEATAFDLILGGSGESLHEDGLLARLVATALGVPCIGTADEIVVQASHEENAVALSSGECPPQPRALPAMVALRPAIALRLFSTVGYLDGLKRSVETDRWPSKVPARSATYLSGGGAEPAAEEMPHELTPAEAAQHVLHEMGLAGAPVALAPSDETMEDVSYPSLFDAPSNKGLVIAVLSAESDGRLAASAEMIVQASEYVAASHDADVCVFMFAALDEGAQRRALAQLRQFFWADVVIAAVSASNATPEVRGRLLIECFPALNSPPCAVVGEAWMDDAFAALSHRSHPSAAQAFRVVRLRVDDDGMIIQSMRSAGKLLVQRRVDPFENLWLTLTDGADVVLGSPVKRAKVGIAQRWTPRLERFFGQADIQSLLTDLKQTVGITRLGEADFIVDVGYGVGNRDGYEAVIDPLVAALTKLGVRRLVVGGSRKVTEELHLLPADRQIGQSGVSVSPRILLAIGVSGAPQHLNYIGPRATIVAFNRDPEAPIMTLNRRQTRPRVFPVVGDLFETVPALIAALGSDREPASPPNKDETGNSVVMAFQSDAGSRGLQPAE